MKLTEAQLRALEEIEAGRVWHWTAIAKPFFGSTNGVRGDIVAFVAWLAFRQDQR